MSMSLAEKYEYQAKVLAALEQELDTLRAKAKMVDDGMVMLPKELTSENGSKFLLIGEFHEIIDNPFHDEDDDDSPETLKVQVSWTTIKDIYAKIVTHHTGKAKR
jgi:hypothetical protein